jgi:hypothetical protein
VLPLSDWAIDELQKLKVMADGSRYVLPNADKSAPADPNDPKYITRSVARCLKRFSGSRNMVSAPSRRMTFVARANRSRKAGRKGRHR